MSIHTVPPDPPGSALHRSLILVAAEGGLDPDAPQRLGAGGGLLLLSKINYASGRQGRGTGLDQLSTLVHLDQNVAPPDELAVHVHLRDRGPVGECLDALADGRGGRSGPV